MYFRVNLIEQSALQDLKVKIIASRTELLNEFKKYDMANTGEFCNNILYNNPYMYSSAYSYCNQREYFVHVVRSGD